MKQIFLVFPLIVILVSACAAAPVDTTPVETELTAVPSNTEVIVSPTEMPTEGMPSMKLPAASFESQVYLDEKYGFAFDYPLHWTIGTSMETERVKQIQFVSSSGLSDVVTLPAGATRLTATVYEWDPKNDLAAYAANWKTAWEASGFTIQEEEELILEQGLPAVQFTVQTPDATVVHLITTLGDRYLVLSGEGNLELVKEIVQRVRPISVK